MAESLEQAHALRELLILLRREHSDTSIERAPLYPSSEFPDYLRDSLKAIYSSARARVEPIASSKLWAADREALLDRLLEKIAPWPRTSVPDISVETLRGWAVDGVQSGIRAWNSAHDPMQKLPAELWGACLPEMSQSERCELLRVSSCWRTRLTCHLPELWPALDILQISKHCDYQELLSRSASYPLRLDVVVRGPEELSSLDAALKAHAGRLRALQLDVSLDDRHAEYNMALAVRTAFRYAAPELASLSLVATQWPAFRLSKFFLLGDAPSLRTVHLNRVPLPAECAALRHATAVRLEGKVCDMDALFDVFPAMTALEVCRPRHRTELPSIPPGSPLTSVSVTGNSTSHPLKLLHASYLHLERVHVAMPDAEGVVDRAVSLAARQGLKSALAVASDLSLEHAAEGRDGRRRIVSTAAFRKARPVEILLSQLAVRELTLTDAAALKLHGDFSLPRLAHLTITCTAVADVDLARADLTISAPELATVEFAGDWPVDSSESRNAFLRDSLGVDDGHGEMLVRVDPERERTIPRRAREMYSYYAPCMPAFSCDDGSWV